MRNKDFPKSMPRRNEIINQTIAREEARLRRKGRGRKHGFVLSPYLDNHTRIFGETDIFRYLADKG